MTVNRFQRALAMGMERLYSAPYQNTTLENEWYQQYATHAQFNDTKLGYYWSNGVYQNLNIVAAGASDPNNYQKIKSLRNPIAAFVSFYQFKLFPNPLDPTVEEKPRFGENVIARLKEIWKRSAWERLEPKASFGFALFGELFLKAAQRPDGQPIIEHIDARYVTELDLDSRGFITWIRQDMPFQVRDDDTGETEEWLLIDVWQKYKRETGQERDTVRHRQWEVKWDLRQTFDSKLPSATPILDVRTGEGILIDFVPIAYAPFVQVANERGASPIDTCFEDIDEVNRVATRLHAMAFRNGRNTWAVGSNMVTPSGQPIPAPIVKDALQSATSIEVEDGDTVLHLPGMATLQSLVPNMPYEQMLGILNAQLLFIQQTKLFELAYFDTDSETEQSGRAIVYRLRPALDRAKQARATVLDAVKRVDEMCLTLGQLSEVEGYSPAEIGTYDSGDFEHDFTHQDMIPPTVDEMADTFNKLVNGTSVRGAATVAGFAEREIQVLEEIGEQPEQ